MRAYAIEGMTRESELDLLRELAGSMPPGARVVEVGSWKGRSTVAIGEGLSADATLYAVDTWRGDPGWRVEVDHETALAEFRANTEGRAIPIVADSINAAKQFDDKSLDWVFIDAEHHVRAVCADIRAWAPKLKPGGLRSGHDYAGRDAGVTDAVRILCRDVTVSGSVWFTRKRPRVQVVPLVRIAARHLIRGG